MSDVITAHACPPVCDAGGLPEKGGHNFSIPAGDKTGGWLKCSGCGLRNIDFDMMADE